MKNSIFIMIIGASLLGACRKHDIRHANFEAVLVEEANYKVGEEVTFNFSGEIDQISFYSGEPLHDYEYSSGSRQSQTQSVRMSFSTNVTNFTAETGQNNQLAVFVSTDYNGEGTYADVMAANWKGKEEIDPFFAIAPDTNPWGSGNNFSSGVIELIDLFEDDKPLYVGFRYKNTPPVETTGWPRAWYVYYMDANVSTLLGTSNLFNSIAVFDLVYSDHFNTDELKTSDIATNIKLQLPPALRPQPAEVWAISPPIYIEEVDHGPDRSTPVKGYRDPMPIEFKYVYTEPGTYTVTFVGSNTDVYGTTESIKQIEVVISE